MKIVILAFSSVCAGIVYLTTSNGNVNAINPNPGATTTPVVSSPEPVQSTAPAQPSTPEVEGGGRPPLPKSVKAVDGREFPLRDNREEKERAAENSGVKGVIVDKDLLNDSQKAIFDSFLRSTPLPKNIAGDPCRQHGRPSRWCLVTKSEDAIRLYETVKANQDLSHAVQIVSVLYLGSGPISDEIKPGDKKP